MSIEGFRSFGDKVTIEFDEKTVFIGANNVGKTSALAALAKIFSHRRSERQVVRSDFHLPKGKLPEEVTKLKMTIECVFEFDELVENGNKGEAKNEAEPIAIPIYFNGLTVAGPGCTPILRVRLEATWQRSTSAEGAIESRIWFITSPEDEVDKYQEAHRVTLDAIRMFYIPAVRDPNDEIRFVSGSVMSSMLSSIKWDPRCRDKVTGDAKGLSDYLLQEPGAASVKRSIASVWRGYKRGDKLTEASLAFIPGDFESIVKNPSIRFSPTFEERSYEVDELGDGYKSLFYLAMIHSLLQLETKIRTKDTEVKDQFDVQLPALTIIAIEEPENHIAPHLLGSLIDQLKKIWDDNACQVVITSHSPAIVGRIDPSALRHFRQDQRSASTICRRLTLPEKRDEAYKYVKSSLMSFPEVLFARAVVLGEGDSEAVVLPRLLEAMLGDADSIGVSVAPIGGRHAEHFWRLLSDLCIPHVTLLDLDNERDGGDEKRLDNALGWLEKCKPDTKEAISDVKKQGKDEKLKYLESQGVFFSQPLDLDFAMLEAFPAIYKDIANPGPRLNGGKSLHDFERSGSFDPSNNDYQARVKSAIKAVLHSGDGHKGGDGHSYNYNQQQLMPWYQNLFLGSRGKPAVHRLAMLEIGCDQLKENAPDDLKKLVGALDKILNPEDDENEGVLEKPLNLKDDDNDAS